MPANIFLTTKYINTGRLLWYDHLAWILNNASLSPSGAKLINFDIPEDITVSIRNYVYTDQTHKLSLLRRIASWFYHLSNDKRSSIIKMLSRAYNVRQLPIDDNRVMLSWSEVREMSEFRINFGNHTESNVNLTKIPALEAQRGIVASKYQIEDQIQQPVRAFAYPYGKQENFNKDIMNILNEEGYQCACTTISGCESIPIDNPLSLKRRGVADSAYLFY